MIVDAKEYEELKANAARERRKLLIRNEEEEEQNTASLYCLDREKNELFDPWTDVTFYPSKTPLE
jgi:hypothetical protein